MAHTIRKVDYFYTTAKDQPGTSYKLLTQLSNLDIDQLAFVAVPTGPNNTQLTIFPDDTKKFLLEANNEGWILDGPHPAILVQGDDELGALVKVHDELFRARINIYASSGVTDGKGEYGYIMYLKPEDYERAAKVLGV